jgi:hypothetical protein
VERWESYALGLLGILLVVTSLALQMVTLTVGNPWLALPLTLGVVSGAFMYRAGFVLISRS